MSIRHQTTIAAGPSEVWALTEDVEHWPDLTPTITRIERVDRGPLRVGSSARVSQPAMGTRTWTVTRCDPPRNFTWETRLGTVTMRGEHEITEIAGGVHNTLSLHLSGFGAGVLERLVRRRIAAALAAENEGFKRAAEARRSLDA